jgi:hypothetical protein
MKNKFSFRLSTLILILFALLLVFGASFSPAASVKTSSGEDSWFFAQIFLGAFGSFFYFIIVVLLLLLGLILAFYVDNKIAGLLGAGVSLASSGGLFYTGLAFYFEEVKYYSAGGSTTSFGLHFPYFVVMAGFGFLLLLSVFALIINLLPEKKKAEVKAA